MGQISEYLDRRGTHVEVFCRSDSRAHQRSRSYLSRSSRETSKLEALILGFVLWFGFYAVQMAGAIIWDNMPWQLGAVHAGDWLMKMLFITLASSEWHRRIGAI
jgi:hypothetical protein